MKKRVLNIVAVFCATVMLFMIGYGILSVLRPNKESPIPIINAVELYAKSCAALDTQSEMVLTIEKIVETRIENSVFTEKANETISIDKKDSGSEYIRSAGTIDIGGHVFSVTQLFTDDTDYLEINGAYFCGNTDPNRSLHSPPAILLNSNVYQMISGVNDGENYIISFEQPTQAEPWAINENDTFVNAKGTAWISYSGQLVKSQYEITSTSGGITTSTIYSVSATITDINIDLPENKSEYKNISYLDGPLMLERASGYLLQAQNVSSKYNDEIYFQAFGDTRTQSITLHTYDEKTFAANVNTETYLKNDSRVGQDTQLRKKELFVNGNYLLGLDGAEPTVNKDVSEKDMQTYCKNLLVGTIILPQHIADIQMSKSESSIHITINTNEEFAKSIRSNAGQTLYQKPEMLDSLIQSIKAESIQCYLDLDPVTGLAIASGICYDGKFIITDNACTLRYKIDQSYDLISENAKEEIQKAAGA